MNERTGLCIPNDGSFEAAWGIGIGAGRYRFSLDLDYGMPREVAQAYVDAGLKLDMCYDSNTFRNGRSDEQAISEGADKYRGLIDIVSNGNEADDPGAESSTMTHARINRMMEISRYYWGDDQFLTTPGLSSGDPNWLDQFDFTHCNGIDIHPYGQWSPDVEVPPDAIYFGRLNDIMERYVAKGKERAGRFVPLVISEYGTSSWQVSEPTQAVCVGSGVDYFEKRSDILICHDIFSFHNHAGFGIIYEDGSWKQACWAYMAAANGQWSPEAMAVQSVMISNREEKANKKARR